MKFPRLIVIWLLLTVGLAAQDITRGPLVWLAIEDTPDELPVARGVSLPELEDAQKVVREPDYLECRTYVSAKGKPSASTIVSSSPWLKQSVGLSGDFIPAKRGGSAVASEVGMIFIYNPPSAALKSPEASPRLLAVQPPVYPEERRLHGPEERVVRVAAGIDATGGVTQATAVEEPDVEFAEAAVAAVKLWIFAPARKAGEPVAATVELRVAFAKAAVYKVGDVTTPPRPVSREAPVYPYELRRTGFSGEVLINFKISIEGRVVDAYAEKSDHPGLEDAALAAVRRWRFEPALKDGRPVVCNATQLLVFDASGGAGSGDIYGFKVAVPKSWPPAVPESLRFEIPPQLEYMEAPVYPLEDLRAKRGGKVTLAYVVDPKGRVGEINALPGAPTPAMAAAAAAALERFKFKPAGRQGKPCYALLRIEFEFAPDGNKGHVPVNEATKRVLRVLDNDTKLLVSAKDLDQRPHLRITIPPVANGHTGRAIVEFVIDRDGIPRVPHLVSTTDPALGYAAIQALANARFNRPLARGRYVDTLVRMPFEFK